MRLGMRDVWRKNLSDQSNDTVRGLPPCPLHFAVFALLAY